MMAKNILSPEQINLLTEHAQALLDTSLEKAEFYLRSPMTSMPTMDDYSGHRDILEAMGEAVDEYRLCEEVSGNLHAIEVHLRKTITKIKPSQFSEGKSAYTMFNSYLSAVHAGINGIRNRKEYLSAKVEVFRSISSQSLRVSELSGGASLTGRNFLGRQE